MSSTIFIVDRDNQLTELTRSDYESEDLLQELLASHPSILSSAGSGRPLLVRREFGVPEAQSGGDRWSLDHLFLDRSGVPILVEVKRASDTRARREVVAQMLDYAANGVAYWPLEQILSAYQKTARASGLDPDIQLAEFLGNESTDQFWRQVEANLRSGRIRMVFVADRIAKEVRRIVEFLNEQMRPAEVVAVEVEQFVSPTGLRTLVPRVLGDTERAQAAKSVSSEAPASEEEWLGMLAERKGAAAQAMAHKLVSWFRSAGFEVIISNSGDSLVASVRRMDGKTSFPFFVRLSTGKLDTALQNLRYAPAYVSENSRLELLQRLKLLTPRLVASDKLTGWPSIPLEEFVDANVFDGFCKLALDVKRSLESVGTDNAS